MNISQKTLREMIPPEKLRMEFWTATAIVQKRYCGPLTIQGICTQNCEDCKARLLGAFQLGDARSPTALLNWRLRDVVARAIEEARPVEKFVPKKDKYGSLQTSENPFEALLR
jgi:hypothetical protein